MPALRVDDEGRTVDLKGGPGKTTNTAGRLSRVASLALPVFLILVLLTAQTAGADTVTATVTVGTQPEGFAFDPNNGAVYVANYASNTVSVISGSSNSVVANVTVGAGPDRVAFDPNNGDVYVSNWGSGTVSVISGATNAVVTTILVGNHCDGVAFDSSNGDVYVAYTAASGAVSVVSGSTNAVVATISVDTGPFHQVAFDSANGDVYVSNYGSGTVSVISGSTNAVIATVSAGTTPNGVVFDSANGDVYVTNMLGSDTVSVISGSTNAVVATVPVGAAPYGVAFDPSNGNLYVSDYGTNDVSVIAGTTNAVVANVTVGSAPVGVVFDSLSGDLYVSNYGSGTVSVITPTSTSSAQSTTTSNSNSSATPLLEQVWVPQPSNAVAAVGISAAVVGAVSVVFALINAPLAGVGGAAAEKTTGLVPDNIRRWLEEIVASRRKLDSMKKTGSPLIPTKPELLAYVTAIIVLAVSFSYVKVGTLSQIWQLLPVFFATSFIVAFVQEFFSIVYMRSRGVWSEHKIWPLGLVLFLFSTFAFKVPFSSPTRTVNESTEHTERLSALSSSFEIIISLAFAGFFYLVVRGGYTAVGGAGLAMCVLGSLSAALPVAPLSGKDVFNHSKRLWALLFITTLVVFVAWLFLVQ